jgi:hypothetical protein
MGSTSCVEADATGVIIVGKILTLRVTITLFIFSIDIWHLWCHFILLLGLPQRGKMSIEKILYIYMPRRWHNIRRYITSHA